MYEYSKITPTFIVSNMWRERLKMLMGAQEMKKKELTRINIMFVLFFLAIFLALLMLVKCLFGWEEEIARQTLA